MKCDFLESVSSPTNTYVVLDYPWNVPLNNRSSHPEFFSKKIFPKNFENFLEKQLCVSFFVTEGLIKGKVFCCEFTKDFRTVFSRELLLMAASGMTQVFFCSAEIWLHNFSRLKHDVFVRSCTRHKNHTKWSYIKTVMQILKALCDFSLGS